MPTTQDKLQPDPAFIRTWESPPGIRGYLSTVNNRPLGQRFMVTAFAFFVIGGVLALLMRVQLAVSENPWMDPEWFNRLFTMHGATMMYLFTVPFLEGLALYMIPSLIGSRDVAFPRLTSFGFWTYLFGALLFYASFFAGEVPDAGWFAYTPLSRQEFSGMGVDFFLLGLSLVEISGIAAGAEIVVTILKLRTAGMSVNRMPLFAWAMLITGIMILFAFTTLLVATLMLELDRSFGMHFFNPDGGGSTILWQHLFWFFGHPEVYIAFIPATGIVSMIVPTFARRPIAGYTWIAVALVVTGFLSFGLWAHHMFATGLPELTLSFFTAASLMIGIASGIQVFAWIGTLWGTRPDLKPAMLFMLGFVFIFVLGGITGIMVAILPFDLQVHDTYFVVAHFHYVLIGGVVFPILGGIHYWFPKMAGRMMNEAMGKLSFWLVFIGFNVTFFPMHILGFEGMPRRVYTYPTELNLDVYNLIATIGAFGLASGILILLIDVFRSLRSGSRAPADPWGGQTLEWSVESPPPPYGFLAPPLVQSREPMLQSTSTSAAEERTQRVRSFLASKPTSWRATLATDTVTGEPESIHHLYGPTLLPFLAAAGLVVALSGVLLKTYTITITGFLFTGGAIAKWLWPHEIVMERLRSVSAEVSGVPVFKSGRKSIGWWGLIYLLAVLATIYAVILFSYSYIRLSAESWPLDGLPQPDLFVGVLMGGMLLLSGLPAFMAQRAADGRSKPPIRILLFAAAALGGASIIMQVVELLGQEFSPQTNAYGTVFFVTHYLQMIVAFVGVLMLAAAGWRVGASPVTDEDNRAIQLEIATRYWYFTVAAGTLAFIVLYGAPRF